MYRPIVELGCFEAVAPAVKVKILAGLLDALILADLAYLDARPETPALYQSGVRYINKPIGLDSWRDIPRCLETGTGDCKDFACWRVAELRKRFNEAGAKPHIISSGRGDFTLFHIQVERANGQLEDPSCHQGMEGAACRYLG